MYLENEYVQLLILPEIGGRVHGALDKTNGYKWLYWQPTIKPGLISMTGAWISGGIEWNFPHGHRPSGFMPVDHRVVKHPDGSATVWVGETEPVYRMRWLVGITLAPGRSYFTLRLRLRQPDRPAPPVPVLGDRRRRTRTSSSQAQYPGDIMTGHGKDGVLALAGRTTASTSRGGRTSRTRSSFFAWQSQDDWFGTYDHEAQGGLVHVADHRVMPGKKLWTWGSGPSGRIWEDILTEGGGPYFEPQAGAFSDNQPDYHWMEPGQVRAGPRLLVPGARHARLPEGDRGLRAERRRARRQGLRRRLRHLGARRPVRGASRTRAADGRSAVGQTVRVSPDRPLHGRGRCAARPHDLRPAAARARRGGGPGADRAHRRNGSARTASCPRPQKPPGPPAELNAGRALPLRASGSTASAAGPRRSSTTTRRCAATRPTRASNVALGGIALDETRWADALAPLRQGPRRATPTTAARNSAAARRSLGARARRRGRARRSGRRAVAADQQSPSPSARSRGSASRRGDARGALAHLQRGRVVRTALLADLPGAARRRPPAAGRARGGARGGASARSSSTRCTSWPAARRRSRSRALGRPADEWEATRRDYMRDSVAERARARREPTSRRGLLGDAEAVLNDAAEARAALAREPPALLGPAARAR